MNYFDFYGLPVKFNLNVQELKSKYLDLLKLNHPDFFVNDALKYKEAIVNSSLNNEAYKCLANFHLRASHILELSGYEFDDKLPPAFLMQMMDFNEVLEELEHNADLVKINALEKDIMDLKDTLNLELTQLSLVSDEVDLKQEALLSAIKVNLLKHKYLLRLKETLANIAAR